MMSVYSSSALLVHSFSTTKLIRGVASQSHTSKTRFSSQSSSVDQTDFSPLAQSGLLPRLVKAEEAARQAGAIIRAYARGEVEARGITFKNGDELVSHADKEADAKILDILKQAFPEDDFLTEETFDPTRSTAVRTGWIIDPLDGTRNFTASIPHFAVSIAYVKDGKPVIGVVYDPMSDELFSAAAGQPMVNKRPMKVSSATEVKDTVISMCNPLPAGFMQLKKPSHRRLGCTALDMAYVAAGRLGASCERNLKVWDIAAGMALVEAAGGKVTDFQGQPLDLTKIQGRVSYVASNGPLHQAMLALVAEAPGKS